MNRLFTCSLRSLLPRALRVGLLSALMVSVLNAQSTSITDGSTPAGATGGAPAGADVLSDLEAVNLFNGHLSFNVPILSVAGRGNAKMAMILAIDNQWSVKTTKVTSSGQPHGHYEYYPQLPEWYDLKPGYGPGVVVGRKAGEVNTSTSCGTVENPYSPYSLSLTRITFILPNGTEFELRDQVTGVNGQPRPPTYSYTCSPIGGYRGRYFTSADGSAATFISDTDIYDAPDTRSGSRFYPTGYLLLRDGTRARVENGLITLMRDNNGNQTSFSYQGFGKVSQIIDSLNRRVDITYDNPDPAPYGVCDHITFKAFNGADRIIRISRTDMSNALRSDFSIRTDTQLFPGSDGGFTVNPKVVSSLWLPDGQKRYRFYYDSYVELARVELPAGGVVEYDYSGFGEPGDSGFFYTTPDQGNSVIYRRVTERRVSADGTSWERKTRYSAYETEATPQAPLSAVTVDHVDQSDSILASQIHSFSGAALWSMVHKLATEYSGWKDGHEYKAEFFEGDSTAYGQVPIKVVQQDWQQRGPVSWWRTDHPLLPLDREPPNDPRLAEVVTTMPDTNQVTKQSYNYDAFNNQTDSNEYDYGSGSNGPLRRHTHIDYLTVNPVNGVDYTSTNIHLRQLVRERRVYSVNASVETLASDVVFEYDGTALADCPGIIGMDPAYLFDADNRVRGNVTRASEWLNSNNAWLNSNVQFDVAGNIVKTKDPLQHETTFDFTDCYGGPDGDARMKTAPDQLLGQFSYAYVTSVTNAVGHTAFSQHDFFTGEIVDEENANNVVTSHYFDDLLGRPTQIIRAVNTTEKSQTTIFYDDSNHKEIGTADLNNFGDNVLKNETTYDGLGRVVEIRKAYSDANNYVITRQGYDALGRVAKVTNPFTPQDESAGHIYWNTREYDALDRIRKTTTPDGARVRYNYQGNRVSVTDQAGQVKNTFADALGRLSEVVEAPWQAIPSGPSELLISGPAYSTTYSYDANNNLLGVTQGVQSRSYIYDSLGRLTEANNPESGRTVFEYDEQDNLKKRTDGRGIIISCEYDSIDRVIRKSFSDGTPEVTFGYDAPGVIRSKGELTSVTSAVSTSSYDEFDALGHVKRNSQVTDGRTYAMRYEYDLAGNVTLQVYPSGRAVTTTFETSGRISQVTGQKSGEANKTYVSAISYAPHGSMREMRLGNQLWEHVSFNTRLQRTQIGLGTASTNSSLLQLDYSYGTSYGPAYNNGNIASQTITVPNGPILTQSYRYDQLNRLFSAEELTGASPNWKQTYQYDRYGNRSFDAANTNIPSPLVNLKVATNTTNNRLDPTISGQSNIFYDLGGNLVRDVNGHTYDYDGTNMQIAYDGGASVAGGVSYAYDGQGHRVKQVVNSGAAVVFVYNGFGQMVAEYSSVVQGSGGTSYLTGDSLGTPRVITDENGAVRARHDYLPFGEEIASGQAGRTVALGYRIDNVRQKFARKERDSETNLDYLGARYYSSTSAKFTTPDEAFADQEPSGPQSWNLYAYVRNRPLLFVDPLGLWQLRSDDGDDVTLTADPGDDLSTLASFLSVPLEALQLLIPGQDGKKFAGGTYFSFSKSYLQSIGAQIPEKVLVKFNLMDGGDGAVNRFPFINRMIQADFDDALQEINRRVGPIAFTEVFRTTDHQKELRAKYERDLAAYNALPFLIRWLKKPPLFARPGGTSSHEAGLAFDVGDKYRSQQVISIFAKHFFFQTVDGDRVHFEASAWEHWPAAKQAEMIRAAQQDYARRFAPK